MRTLLPAICALSLLTVGLGAQPTRIRAAELRNGAWFTDSTFLPRTMYIVGDRFRSARPARVDTVIDLTGQYIVPPYGDAHTHAFSAEARLDDVIRSHRADGVFYAMNLMNANSTRRAIAARLNTPQGVDVQLASAGITGVRGHPILSEEMAANGWRWDSLGSYWNALLTSTKADGDSYIVMDGPADVARRWPLVLANAPGVVKIFLQDSDRFAALRADETQLDVNGLDPRIVPAIVQSAHARGLRVAAHITTAADFRVAVRAGVDIIAICPGWRSPTVPTLPQR